MDAKVNQEIFRKNHPIIIASNRHLASILPVRLAYNADGYVAGQVLARNTTSGLHAKYDDGASSGLNTAVGVLFEDVPVEKFASSSDTVLARGIFGGELFEAKLTGLDANAKTDLKSRSITDARGVVTLKF